MEKKKETWQVPLQSLHVLVWKGQDLGKEQEGTNDLKGRKVKEHKYSRREASTVLISMVSSNIRQSPSILFIPSPFVLSSPLK